MSTATATATATATINVPGLSTAIRAAELFSAKAKSRAGSIGLSGIELSTAGCCLAIDSTNNETAFHAIATSAVSGDSVSGEITPAGLSSALKSGFESATIGNDSFTVGGLSVPFLLPTTGIGEVYERLGFNRASRITIDAATLQRIAKEIVPATDDEMSRYALGGVYFDVSETTGDGYGRCHAVGTDGRRLHALTMPGAVSPDDTPRPILIPGYVVAAAAKAAKLTIPRGTSLECVAITIEGNENCDRCEIFWRAGEFSFSIRAQQLQGRFPKWRDVFTDSLEGRIEDDSFGNDETAIFCAAAGDIVAACKDAAAGVCKPASRKEKARAVRLESIDEKSIVSAKSPAGSYLSELGGYASRNFSRYVDPAYLSAMLAGFHRDDSVMLYGTPDTGSAVYVRSGRGISSRHSVQFSAVLMPCNSPE